MIDLTVSERLRERFRRKKKSIGDIVKETTKPKLSRPRSSQTEKKE